MRLAWLGLVALTVGIGLSCHAVMTRTTVLLDCHRVGVIAGKDGQPYEAHSCSRGVMLAIPADGEKLPPEIGV